MNLLLFNEHERLGGDLILLASDSRFQHITNVLKASVGDHLNAGQINGSVGKARIKTMDAAKITLDVELLNTPPLPSPIRLILALPRPKVLGRTIRTITELGVKHIDLVQSARVEKSYWTAHQLTESYLQTRIMEGLTQTRDTQVPTLTFNPYFKPFVEDTVASIKSGYDCWVAHPYTQTELPEKFTQKSLIAVGPEGGWVDFEIELFKSLGFQIGHMGLRTFSTGVFIPTLLARGLS